MKTAHFTFATLALLLGLAACTKEEAIDSSLPEGVEGTPIVFTATELNLTVTATGLTLEDVTIGDWVEGGDNIGEAEERAYVYNETTNTYTAYTVYGLLAWNEAVQNDLSMNFTLAADIDLTNIDYEWLLVGNYDNQYTGIFDGGGYTIKGLTNNQSGGYYVGMIGCLGEDGQVQNLTLKDMDITGYWYVGGVVGRNSGTVTYCYWSNSQSSGVGRELSGTIDVVTKVEDEFTWFDAVDGMNLGISTWNSDPDNSDKQCEWKYELLEGNDYPTLTKN